MCWNPDPVEETCPLIDELEAAINMNDWEHFRLTRSELLHHVEQVRQANAQLRTWGRKLYFENQRLLKENLQLSKDLERRI